MMFVAVPRSLNAGRLAAGIDRRRDHQHHHQNVVHNNTTTVIYL